MGLLKSASQRVVSFLKPKVRDLGAELLHRATALDPSRLARDKLTIATFHRVLPERELIDYPMPGISVTPEELDWLLAAVHQALHGRHAGRDGHALHAR